MTEPPRVSTLYFIAAIQQAYIQLGDCETIREAEKIVEGHLKEIRLPPSVRTLNVLMALEEARDQVSLLRVVKK